MASTPTKYRILDLDGCIANDEWRIPAINWQMQDPTRRYHDYHALAPFDELANADLLNTDQRIIILTARPVMFCAPTQEWLRRKGIAWVHMIMRNDSDHAHSAVLKAQQLEWLTTLYGVALSDIVSAFDDRPEIVQMYLKAGLNAAVRACHSARAYTPPQSAISAAESP